MKTKIKYTLECREIFVIYIYVHIQTTYTQIYVVVVTASLSIAENAIFRPVLIQQNDVF